MPYRNTSELPPEVKKAHPTVKGREAFLAAFNRAHHAYHGDEHTAFRVAHAAADRAEGKRPRRVIKARRTR